MPLVPPQDDIVDWISFVISARSNLEAQKGLALIVGDGACSVPKTAGKTLGEDHLLCRG